MKIKQFKFKQILKLHLLKSSFYKNSSKKNDVIRLINVGLTQAIADFKKVLHIIFRFNQVGKKILFIGMPIKLERKINKLTNHVAVSKDFDLQGIFSRSNILKLNHDNKNYFSKPSVTLLLPKLVNKPDLVVLISSTKAQIILSESFVAKVPLITFEKSCESKNSWFGNAYNVRGFGDSLELSNSENILFIGLDFLFKKRVQRSVKSNVLQDLNKRRSSRLN